MSGSSGGIRPATGFSDADILQAFVDPEVFYHCSSLPFQLLTPLPLLCTALLLPVAAFPLSVHCLSLPFHCPFATLSPSPLTVALPLKTPLLINLSTPLL